MPGTVSSTVPQVLVVGAGPTGLVLALQLARRGVRVRIVDRAEGPGTASRAMVVQARTLEFYRQLGFAEAVVAEGVKIPAVRLREGGEEVARVAFGDLGAGESPYPFVLAYAQDDHERRLAAELEKAGVAVEWGTALAGLSQDGAGVRALLSRGGAEEACAASYLCGCDGAHSRVRESLGIGFPGGTYDQLFYVADTRIAGGLREDLSITLGAHGFGLMLPVRLSGMQRLIGLVPEALAGRSGLASEALTFEDLRPGVEALMGIRVEAVNWFSTYRVHHRVADAFRAGRCFLAGDAGHVHSPAGGQGMNTGIGDAVNLAWKLAEVVAGRAGPALLDTYEPERIAFARSLVATTDRAFRAVAGPGLGSQVLRTWLLPHLVPALWGIPAARRRLFDTVSQVRIAYHDSPLSGGRAGTVQGGDRLPYLAAAAPAGPDTFAPLADLRWQLHVHGAADPALAAEARRAGWPLHVFPWSEAAREAGFARDEAYLVRPDGYVALAGPGAGTLAAYRARWGLAAPARPAAGGREQR